MNKKQLKRNLLVPPGDSILEHINFIGMSREELSNKLNLPINKVNDLIKGIEPITREIAIKLDCVLGIPYHIWLKLEEDYKKELLENNE